MFLAPAKTELPFASDETTTVLPTPTVTLVSLLSTPSTLWLTTTLSFGTSWS